MAHRHLRAICVVVAGILSLSGALTFLTRRRAQVPDSAPGPKPSHVEVAWVDADVGRVSFPWVATIAAVVVALGATAVALPLMSRSLPTAADPRVSIQIDVSGVRAEDASLLFTVGADREDGQATSNRLQMLVKDAPSGGVISISLTGTGPSAPMRCFRVEPTQEIDTSSIVGARSRVIHEIEAHQPESHGGYRWADSVDAGENVRLTCLLESAFSWSSELGTRYIAVPGVDLYVDGEPRELSSAEGATTQGDEATKCVNLMTPSLATTGYPSTYVEGRRTLDELIQDVIARHTRTPDGPKER